MRKLDMLNIAVVILFLLIPIQTISSMKHKSVFGDEVGNIVSGYSKLKTLDYRLNPEQGPLSPMISALPLLFLDVNFPFDHSSWKIKNLDTLMYIFLFEYNDDPYDIVFWARIPMVGLSMLLALFIFKWSKEMYGKAAGVFALFLYTFSPNMLAHARISSSDFGLTVFAFIAVYYFWRFFKQPTKKLLVVAGITLGLALLTKFSAIMLFPIYGVITLILFVISYPPTQLIRQKIYKRIRRVNLRRLIFLTVSLTCIFVVTYLVMLFGYRFEGMFTPLADSMRADIHLNKTIWPIESFTESNTLIGFALEKVPSPLPYYFARGLGYSFQYADDPSPSLVVGDHLETKWYFFLYSFLLKTPISMLVFLVLSLLLYKKINNGCANEVFLILPFLLFHLAFTLTQKQFGYRYVIHTIPFLIVFVSKLVNLEIKKSIVTKLAFIALCAWYVFSSFMIYPHYISYFNEFIGPKNAYKVMVGSNIDWGQDLLYLSEYVQKNNLENIMLSYYGFAPTTNWILSPYYNISYTDVPCERTEGVIVISVTDLMGKQGCYGWLLKEEPSERIAYSMLVYNITN